MAARKRSNDVRSQARIKPATPDLLVRRDPGRVGDQDQRLIQGFIGQIYHMDIIPLVGIRSDLIIVARLDFRFL
eukprot:scaffold235431_cov20-Prasinocladus_malaysianus.AAC.1